MNTVYGGTEKEWIRLRGNRLVRAIAVLICYNGPIPTLCNSYRKQCIPNISLESSP